MLNTWAIVEIISFGPLHTKTLNPKPLCPNNDRDTWPHLLSRCENPHTKGLRVSRHNKAVHVIAQTLQANKSTRFFTLTNANNFNNKPPDSTLPEWLLKCTYTTCKCQAKLRLDIMHNRSPQTPILPPMNLG